MQNQLEVFEALGLQSRLLCTLAPVHIRDVIFGLALDIHVLLVLTLKMHWYVLLACPFH
jgi:hypothetical protein